MRSRLPNNLKIPALFGIVFYAVLFLGRNSSVLEAYPVLNLIGIFVLATVLYVFVFGLLKNPLNVVVGAAGYRIARILVALLLPFGVFIYQRFYASPEEQFNSLLEKQNISITPDNKACVKYRYGKFTDGQDTVVRFKEDETDFELAKKEKLRIVWADSCLYYTVNEHGVVLKIVRLGNFNPDGTFIQYSKPGVLHQLSDEKISRFKRIN